MFKSISQRNAQNRAKLPYDHRGGSRPFIYHVDTEIGHGAENSVDETGEESEDHSIHDEVVDLQTVKAVKLFYDTHYSQEKGWINDVAKQKYDQMLSLLENSQSSPDGPITEFQAAQTVLGPTRSYVRGLGRSIIPPLTSEGSSSTSKDDHIIALRTEMDNMKQSQEEREKNLLEKIEEREKQMEERGKQMEEKMIKILAVVERLQQDNPHIDDN